MHFKQKSSVTLNENAKQVNCSKKNSISVPKSKQSSSTRNPISININKLSLRSLIQDNCVNVKSKTGKLTAMTNFNQVKEDKFSREEEENLDVEERNSNDGFNFNSLIPNTSMTEFDNFDDINSIVKKLNFDKIDPKRENIFSQNNFVYKNFEEKFNEEFEAFKHRSHNKRVNYSASTKDNSSSKKGYPYQRE